MKSTILTLALLALAGPAIAQTAGGLTQQHFDAIDQNKDGTISKAEYDAFMADAFTQLDKNGNGSLSPAETANVFTVEQFAVVDADSNGRITREEFLVQVSKDFVQSDRDRNGNLN